MDCLTLGEPLICFDSGDDTLDAIDVIRTYAVGAESNVAIGLARLGRTVGYVGRVGADSLGRRILRTLRGEGVDVSGIVRDETAPTAVLLKERLRTGATAVTYHRTGSAGSGLSAADLPPSFDGVRHVHVTGITLQLSDTARAATLEAMRRARAAGARVSLDANFRRKLASDSQLVATFGEAADLADDVLIGRAEAALCAGASDDEAIDRYAAALNAPIVVVKGRRGGARAFTADGVVEVDAVPTTVIDPVGAGDAFAVGYLHARLDGGGLREALTLGGRVAARVIGSHGDYHGLPYSDEIEDGPTTNGGIVR